jgi:heme/copper-type cytochrome/quinol oxidase subunit 2
MIKGIVLIILAISGNIVAQTFGCKSQKVLSENIFAKHIVILFILYFSIGFTNSNEDDPKHPLETIKLVIIIYILFIMLTKMNVQFTILVFIILIATYINNTFIDYYKKVSAEQDTIKRSENLQDILITSTIVIIIIGFILGFHKQYNDHKKHWSLFTFLFRVNDCDYL